MDVQSFFATMFKNSIFFVVVKVKVYTGQLGNVKISKVAELFLTVPLTCFSWSVLGLNNFAI